MGEEATTRATELINNMKALKEKVNIDTKQLRLNTQDLLDLTQIRMGKFHKNIEAVQVFQVLTKGISAHKLNAKMKNIKFEIIESSETA